MKKRVLNARRVNNSRSQIPPSGLFFLRNIAIPLVSIFGEFLAQIDKMFSFIYMETQTCYGTEQHNQLQTTPTQKVYFSTLLGLGPRFLPHLYCYLESFLYFLPFLNPQKNRWVRHAVVCKIVLFFFSQSVLKGAKLRGRLSVSLV